MQHDNDNMEPISKPLKADHAEIADYAVAIPLSGLNRILESLINVQQGASYISQATTLAGIKDLTSEAVLRFKLAYLYEGLKA